MPDYNNALHNFATAGTYTMTSDGFLIGTYHAMNATIKINGHIVSQVYKSGGNPNYDAVGGNQIYLPISKDDIIIVSANDAGLMIYGVK